MDEGSPDSNFGGVSWLRTDGGGDPEVDSLLRFRVDGLAGSVQKAVLRLHVRNDPTVDGPALYASEGGWSEAGVTWNTRPVHALVASADSGMIVPFSWIEFDVTALVRAEGTYDFALVSGSSDGVNFDSRETADAPQLVVTTDADNEPPSPPAPALWTLKFDDEFNLRASTWRSGARIGSVPATRR